MDKIFSRKNIIIGLGVLFGLQIVIYLSLSIFSSKNIKERTSGKPLLKGFKKENVSSIEIKDYQSSFVIEIKDDNYLVKNGNNYIPGDPDKIKYYLDVLKNLSFGVIRDYGKDPDSSKLYGLDRERTQDVIVKMKNKREYVIHLGSQGTREDSSYIRYGKEKVIREVDSDISTVTGNKPILWAQRKVLNDINFEDVDSCGIDSSTSWYNGKYTIKYQESTDKKKNELNNYIIDPPANGEVKDFSLANVIVSFIQLNVDDYKLNGPLTKDNEEAAKVIITLKNNKSYKLTFYKPGPDDNGYYILAVDFNKYLYYVKEDQVKMLIRSTEDFIKKDETKK